MKLFRAWLALVWLSFQRLLWSTSTLMVLFPLAGSVLFVARRGYGTMPSREFAFERLSDFLLVVFAAFLLPVCALAYGTASIGNDREDRTLLFVLVRPIPRWLVVVARFVAALPLALGLVMGSFYLLCWLAGAPGQLACHLYAPAMFGMTLAYLGLFHLFAVTFRHATIIALLYALFMELLLGNMPGIVKRVAVNYYGRSLIYAAGADHGLPLPDPRWFEPLSPWEAQWTLAAFAACGLLLAVVVFQRREYRDLT